MFGKMDLERLLYLAGVQLDESTLAKYAEPKANHTKKTGGTEVKAKEGKGKTTSTSKYAEPKANHKVKTGCKNCGHVHPAEGKCKVPSTGRYKDHNSTK